MRTIPSASASAAMVMPTGGKTDRVDWRSFARLEIAQITERRAEAIHPRLTEQRVELQLLFGGGLDVGV